MPNTTLNFLKGRMAEVLVDCLFMAEYHVRLFGAPWKFETLATLRGEQKPPEPVWMSKTEIRTDEPDYVVYPKREKKAPEFIEVKFRQQGRLRRRYEQDLIDQCLFWSEEFPLSVVVVNCTEKPYFNVLRAPYIDKKGNFIPLVPLMDAGWRINRDTYYDCESLIESGIFDGVCR